MSGGKLTLGLVGLLAVASLARQGQTRRQDVLDGPLYAGGAYAALRSLAMQIKSQDADAIEEAARQIVRALPLTLRGPRVVLVPVPSSKGDTTANLRLAQALARRLSARVADVLQGVARQSNVSRKRSGQTSLRAQQMPMSASGLSWEPSSQVFFVDNVFDTGETMRAARRALGRPAGAMVLAVTEAPWTAPRGSLARTASGRFVKLNPVPAGFTTAPLSFVRGHVLEYAVTERGAPSSDAGLFHVTTNLPAVLQEGRLRSRHELRQVGRQGAGLGGGLRDEARDKVSLGITLEGSLRVLEGTRMMARAVHGQVSAVEALGALQRFSAEALGQIEDVIFWATEDPTSDEHEVAVQVEHELQRGAHDVLQATPGPDLYDALRRYESVLANAVSAWQENGWIESEGCDATIGFTEPSHKFSRVDPENIGLVKLAVRRSAPKEFVTAECEIRVKPEDVVLVGVWRPW